MFDIELDDGTPGQRKLKLPYNQTGKQLPHHLHHMYSVVAQTTHGLPLTSS